MNQIFKITIGQDTINGKLPGLRVGQGFCSVFHIAGVDSSGPPPKVWVTVNEDSYFWTSVWLDGVWQCVVNAEPTQKVGTKQYAITMGGGDDGEGGAKPEYIAGQGTFTVYHNIAGSGTGTEGGEGGQTITGQIAALDDRLTIVEGRLGDFATLSDLNTALQDYVDKASLSSGVETIQTMPTDTPAQREARFVALLNLLFGL